MKILCTCKRNIDSNGSNGASKILCHEKNCVNLGETNDWQPADDTRYSFFFILSNELMVAGGDSDRNSRDTVLIRKRLRENLYIFCYVSV